MSQSPSLLAEVLTLREAAACRALPDERLIWLLGDDAHAWLQGQVTQDVRDLSTAKQFCLCEPTGQLLAIGRAWMHEGRIAIVLDAKCLPPFEDRVERMVISEDVRLESDPRRCVTIQGPEAVAPFGNALVLSSDRTGSGGFDIWSEDDAVPPNLPMVSDEAWNVITLEAGIPILGVDTNAKTLPPELGPAFESAAISYTKGCYTGQEVLMRIHSRGHTNRVWRVILCHEHVLVGGSVFADDRVEAGVVTRFGFSPRFGWIAAAMLRKEASDPGCIVQVDGPNGAVEGVVRVMPLFQNE